MVASPRGWWAWAAGNRPSPPRLNGFQSAYKTANQSVTNSIVTVNDNDLYINVDANEVWGFEATLLYSGTTGGDIRYGWTFPSGAACPWGRIGPNTSLTTEAVGFASTVASGTIFGGGGNGDANVIVARLLGTIINGSTAGTLQLVFAQATAVAAEAATMRIGSNMTARRLA